MALTSSSISVCQVVCVKGSLFAGLVGGAQLASCKTGEGVVGQLRLGATA